MLDEAARAREPRGRRFSRSTVCDPACGSGHFLIAAAHRIAKRLAAVRTGDEEPAPAAYRTALRDVIGRCIYGVDVNPMAVELCKVALWMEALEPGRPLGFLDHRIVCGNSLLGTTPALIAEGVPADAFTAIGQLDKRFEEQVRAALAEALPGSDHAGRAARGLVGAHPRRGRRQDGRRRAAQAQRPRAAAAGRLRAGRPDCGGGCSLAEAADAIATDPEASPADVRAKAKRYAALEASAEHERARLLADAWCTAFVGAKQPGVEAVTQSTLDQIAKDPARLDPAVRAVVEQTARRLDLFHWHVAFPEVFQAAPSGTDAEPAGWSGGFDVVLGNPPWERTKLRETRVFRPGGAGDHQRGEQGGPSACDRIAGRRAARAASPRSLSRDATPTRLATSSDALAVSRCVDADDINTYAVFAENNQTVIGPRGRVGCIVPTGIATDDTTKHFFRDVVERHALVSLYDFKNNDSLFYDVGHRRAHFSLLTLSGRRRPVNEAEFVFSADNTEHLTDPARRFTLTPEDIGLLNPNTRTCPIFRSRRDAEITKGIYRRVPVLVREGDAAGNPWGVSFRQGLFNMASDSHLFHTREEIEAEGGALTGNVFEGQGHRYLPLYEAKMLHHFDHRFGDYAMRPEGSRDTQLPDVPLERLNDPDYAPLPRYWVSATEVERRLSGRWDCRWLLGWRDITNSTNERTLVASTMPRTGVNHKFPLILTPGTAEHSAAEHSAGLYAALSSFVVDYLARQKLGSTSMTFFVLKQLPLSTPNVLADHLSWLKPRVLELAYTAHDLAPFAADLGYTGPPFRWNPERRFLLRAELDAALFHIYGVEREDVDYILDTFPIVRRNDEQRHGEYRTKRVILEIYDEMAEAQSTGGAYQTRLDPPPADPSVAHGAQGDARRDEGVAAA